MARHEYRVTPAGFRPAGRQLPPGCRVRVADGQDRLELASLMIDAYTDTIDYEGETLEQAVEEVDGYLAGEAVLDLSRVATLGGEIQSAVLVSRIAGVYLVGYVMTRAAVKGEGLASALMDTVANAVWASGAEEMRAFITEGNLPSERIFLRVGYEVVASYGE